ncbi:MAG: glycosyltransferase family 39 protein [Chloroflexota bacterium]|nr:glycosyltransferase family 39 protein [Chloroflexota bacterium]
MDIPAADGLPALAPATRSISLADRMTTNVNWAQLAGPAVSALAAILYIYNLAVSGFANTYYSIAAQAASQSWSAWFWGSLDSGNFITLDKPPLATMLMGLSVRLFGLSSWSILLPEALCGVATVALLFIAVRRYFGVAAATIAALVAAFTPVAVLIFRYNNPDALLTLLLVGAGYAFMRGLEHARLRWIVLSALLVGLAFNTKFLQAYLVLPAFALTYFIAAPVGVARRVGHLLVALATVLVSSLWWVAAVELTPIAQRPFIGGSSSNSALELLLGYDGLQRIFGFLGLGGDRFAGGPTGISGPGANFSGEPGILRMFNPEFGGQIAWLLPIALVGLVAGLILRGRLPRTHLRRAAYLMWGTWLLVTALVFSFMAGIVHSYYAVVLAPPIGALVGVGAVELWSLRKAGGRRGRAAMVVLAAGVLGSAVLAAVLLARSPQFYPWLGPVIVALGIGAAALLVIPRPRLALAGAALGVAVLLIGPAAYSLDTISSAYAGGDPQAGPQTRAEFAGLRPTDGLPGVGFPTGGRPPDGFPGDGRPTDGLPDGQPGGGPPAFGSVKFDDELISFLESNHTSEIWLVAVTSSAEAAPLQLATGVHVMAIGGFNGGDDALTVDRLQAYVDAGQLRFIVLGGGLIGGAGGNAQFAALTAWVQEHGTPVPNAGSGTLYDLRPSG